MNDRVWRIKMQTARALWRAAYTDKRGCLKNRKSVSGYERENGQKKKKKKGRLRASLGSRRARQMTKGACGYLHNIPSLPLLARLALFFHFGGRGSISCFTLYSVHLLPSWSRKSFGIEPVCPPTPTPKPGQARDTHHMSLCQSNCLFLLQVFICIFFFWTETNI